MDERALHPDLKRLSDLLEALAVELEGDDRWATQVRRASEEIVDSNANGLYRFLGFFGGMGSLNDIFISNEGDKLKAEAWDLANRLERELGATQRP